MAKKQKQIDYASLYTLRSDGRYQGYYRDAQNKRHVVCDKDPEKLYFKIQEKSNVEKKPVMFSDIHALWEQTFFDKLPLGTQDSYRASKKRAKEWFGDCQLDKIYTHDISVRLEQMKNEGKAKNTINIQRVVLRSIFHCAINHPEYGKIIQVNPVSEAKLPKGLPEPQTREAPEDDIIQLIQDKSQDVPFGDFALFLMGTGMRRGEALAIQYRDIDFSTGMITVGKAAPLRGARGIIKEPKTESGKREVPILDPIRHIVEKPNNAKDTDYLFHGEDPSLPMANSCYNRRWKRYCREMGFVTDEPEIRVSKTGRRYTVHNYKNTLTAHVLRHGYATMLYEAGIDEKEGKAFMGHKDEEILRKVYTHLRNKKKSAAADRLKEKTKHGFVNVGGG